MPEVPDPQPDLRDQAADVADRTAAAPAGQPAGRRSGCGGTRARSRLRAGPGLEEPAGAFPKRIAFSGRPEGPHLMGPSAEARRGDRSVLDADGQGLSPGQEQEPDRSEERRVGKECRTREATEGS